MRAALILICAAVVILVAFALNPGVGILVALLAYGGVQGVIKRPAPKRTADEDAIAYRKAMGYDK